LWYVVRMKRLVIILGVILLVLGVIGLVHPSFNYHQQEEVAKIGPIKATVNEEKTAQIPVAVSIVLLVAGIGLVLFGPRMKQ
jgi:Flp pilus assembly protein CpaB